MRSSRSISALTGVAFALFGATACERDVRPSWRYGGEPGAVSTPTLADGFVAWGSSSGLHLFDRAGQKICVQRTLGSVEAAPAAAEGRVWAANAAGELFALDARCAVLWRAALPGRATGGITHYAGTLFISTFAGRILAINARTGAVRWSYPPADAPPHRAFEGGPPVVVGDRIYAARQEGELVLLARASGEVIARLEAGPVNTPLTVSDGRVWGHDETGALWAVEGEEIVSRYELESPATAAPLVTERRVYVANTEREIVAVSRTNGRVLWRFRTRGPVEGRLGLFRGRLVGAGASGDGNLYVVDPTTGEGTARFRGERRFSHGVTVADDLVLAANEDGHVYAFDAFEAR